MSGRAINWYLQRITGAALLVLLVMHFWVEHFTAELRTPAGLTFEVIQRRFFQNPWFVAVDISFLFIALYHGLNGVRNICLDYTWGVRWRTPITGVLLLVGGVVGWWGVDAFMGNPHLSLQPIDESVSDEESNSVASEAMHMANQVSREELLRILGIARDTSGRGDGISLHEALQRTHYSKLRSGFSAADFVPLIGEHPDLVTEWSMYSEDKRTSGGYALDGTSEADVAAYVVRELDFWASR